MLCEVREKPVKSIYIKEINFKKNIVKIVCVVAFYKQDKARFVQFFLSKGKTPVPSFLSKGIVRPF